jgi:hypothetical protein
MQEEGAMCSQNRGSGKKVFAFIIGMGVAAAGCGDLTAGGVGQGEAVVSGNGQGASGSAAYSQAPRGGAGSSGAFSASPATDIEGEVTVELEVLLVSEGGGAETLSAGVREVTVDIAGDLPQALGPVSLPAGSYSEARVVFHRVEAQVLGGLEVVGLPIEGPITVDFEGSATLLVERPVSVEVVDGGGLILTVHLRSADWLRLLDPVTLLVPAATFTGSVEVQAEASLP